MPDVYRFQVNGHIPVIKVHHEPRPGPAVIVLHGLYSNADDQRGELEALAKWGLAAVGMDAPHHGARRDGWLDGMPSLDPAGYHTRLLSFIREAVPEVSRVIDHVVGEGHEPIGLAGVSFGAYTALAVAARDSRVQATVSLLGSPDWTPRDGHITEELRGMMQEAPVHRPWDCARHPLLLLNAGRDSLVPAHQARDFAHRLWREFPELGSHVSHYEYPESDHTMRAEDWYDAWDRALGFLRRTLYRE
ncbi:dienelactone hydrolase family protein [Corallococcus aberystwythensis]|uniref:Alpha/beta hydrolase n=1 Tax=Corallococcus aberystwythensis TaxID=2316722 RepID=A0A3A8R2Y8_9BACT|nr:dienelactone hydrolase family protein [Corallococcus aberystwythensis]RKH73155.1 alpha/beta hydrolase [Corallococcus aberystwythensis]